MGKLQLHSHAEHMRSQIFGKIFTGRVGLERLIYEVSVYIEDDY